MEKKQDIIYLASVNWDTPKQRIQQIALGLSKEYRVFYINPRPIILDIVRFLFRRMPYKEIKRRAKLQKLSENLYLITPFFLFGFRINNRINFRNLFSWVNNRIMTSLIHKLTKIYEVSNPILWLIEPSDAAFMGKFNEKLICYDCLDNHPYFYKGKARRLIEELERGILEKANIVFAASSKLMEKCKPINPNTYLVPNGVDINHFLQGQTRSSIPPDIKYVKHPIVGYIGAIEAWVDLDLIHYVAHVHHDWSLILIGPVHTNINKLKEENNIYLLGVKDHSIISTYISLFDVCLIPFKINNLTNYVNPIKLYEYCAMGKPVVATNLRELKKYSSICRLSKTYDEFVSNIERSLKEDTDFDRQKRIEFASHNTWGNRVKTIKEIISSTMKSKYST